MTAQSKALSTTSIIILAGVIFVLGRMVGTHLFENNWSFTHWSVQPVWYSACWAIVFAISLYFVRKLPVTFAEWIGRGKRIYLAGAILLAGVVLLQFDSFYFGAGNLRIAQVAQADKIIIRWFELGAVSAVAAITNVIHAISTLKPVAAGELAWRIYSFAMTALTLLGAIALSRRISEKSVERVALSILLFFGPHSLVLFGYVGPESVVPAVVLWSAWWIWKSLDSRSILSLLGLWLTVFAGIAAHISCVYLLPAALFATVISIQKKRRIAVAAVTAILLHATCVIGLYYLASTNLEIARIVVPISGISPDTDYGLFSVRHISDHLQRVFLVFPLVIVALYVLVTRWKQWSSDPYVIAALFMTAGGGMASFFINPVNSVVADLPRMAAVLAPAALLLTLLLIRTRSEQESNASLSLSAVVALFVPLSVIPVYRSTLLASQYVAPYYDKHDAFYYTGALSFRDAFYALGNYDKANEWEQILPIKSPQHINIHGCRGLVSREEFGEAIRALSLMKVRYPFWVEARAFLATIQLTLRRPDLAKPDIDTALMIDPYDKSSLITQYAYYRETGDFARAIAINELALGMYPSDTTIIQERIALYYRRGDLVTAEKIADETIISDSALAFPWLIKGIAAQARQNTFGAMEYYQKFIEMAPNDPDIPRVRKWINEITLDSRGDSVPK